MKGRGGGGERGLEDDCERQHQLETMLHLREIVLMLEEEG